MLKENVDLLPTTDKDDGTANYEIEPDQDVQSMSTNHDQMDTSEDGVSLSTMDSGPVPLDLSNNSVDLGSFSLVHPPIDSKLRQQIWNREFVDLGVLYFRKKKTYRKPPQSRNLEIERSPLFRRGPRNK